MIGIMGGGTATVLLVLLASLSSSHRCHAFYLPGVNPQSFAEGEPVKLKVNKMTSSKTLLPIDYYRLPFCPPANGPKMDNENLGEFLAGDRIESSPYLLKMKTEMYCEQVCIANLGKGEQKGMKPNRVVQAIRKEYHNNWIVDNLSAASKVEDDTTITTRYWQGFPVGFIGDDHISYIHNHVNIEILYHPVDSLGDDTQKYRVVRFTVEPFSIKHDFEGTDDAQEAEEEEGFPKLQKWAKIKKPIASCDPTVGNDKRSHTSWEMVTEIGRDPQPASGRVLFTYDVHWESSDIHWASRWDIYLSMDNAIPAKVHWLSIANSLVIVCVLSAMIIAILLRNLRQDLARYNRLATDEEKADDLEEKGWKLVHADVFRPPTYSPLLLSVACGTGAQLLCMTFWTIIFSAMGFLSPARRGALLMAELLFYVLMGSVNGYVTSRLYKTFKGKAWQNATLCTALGFPGICFILFFILDLIAWGYGSTDAVPFTTMLVLLVLWFGISTPLVFLGAYFGYKQDAIEYPVKTSNIPRQIPDQPWFMSIPFTLFIGGLLPFGACFVELYFILASVWMDYYYYVFGFLLLVFIILIITCAEITLLFNYFQLCNEDYHWWWRSFATSGSTAIWVFLYSFVYFQQLEANSFATYVLYFGYMGLASLGLFLMTGFIGVAASLWFNKTIFSSLKVD
ncbi:endomembrane protein 70-domain containing protein [Nitzschia inconspicua]|uniref:Transmembrane 9 superfamily member n=1 Tax=Nitzschia inconspicua TaxID=303405 RepID=A0A9K3LQW4_9STRA|nr:endomembrane protein 70-domain containing protein [Nitzschia inconspicua]